MEQQQPNAAVGESLYAPVVDGERLLMAAMELVMTLFALLYAFPHVPSRLLDRTTTTTAVGTPAPSTPGRTTWYSVASYAALVAAIGELTRNSPVFRVCRPAGEADQPLSPAVLSDPKQLDRALGLQLYEDEVPVTCQQMYHNICAVYDAVFHPPWYRTSQGVTREWLQRLFQDVGLLSGGAALSATTSSASSDQAGLILFCSERTVDWLQPYFASSPLFYYPTGLTSACA